MGTLNSSLYSVFCVQQQRIQHYAHSSHNFGKVRCSLLGSGPWQAVKHTGHIEEFLYGAEKEH